MPISDTSILIIDDNDQIRESLELFLGRHYNSVTSLSNPNNLKTTLNNQYFDVVLLDMNFSPGKHSGNEGIFWMNEILKIDQDAAIILITAFGKVELAVKGIKEGAFDFVLKPWDNNKLLATIKAGIKFRNSRKEIKTLKDKHSVLNEELHKEFVFLKGNSPLMNEVNEMINKVAETDANVLILGENGTGKEMVARELHLRSNRKDQIFMPVDLSSLTESLFESELFGYKKGAFTDAKEDRMGKIEASAGGTLFLDEIGNLPLHLQSKLLSVIQTKSVIELGASNSKPVDFRLISATNKPIIKYVKDELFREDLLFRINTVQIEIPPLRERAEDIMPLCEHFLHLYTRKYAKSGLKITSRAVDKLEKYSWPGNVRELKHAVERAVILSNGNQLKPESFAFFDQLEVDSNSMSEDILNLTELEKMSISKAIKKANGNMSKAADMLGISRTTLYFKISKYGL